MDDLDEQAFGMGSALVTAILANDPEAYEYILRDVTVDQLRLIATTFIVVFTNALKQQADEAGIGPMEMWQATIRGVRGME